MLFTKILPQKIAILILAALLISAQPANAYTLNNQIRYPFPADFQQRIEAVEKVHGLKFHITTTSYDQSKVFPFSNAGADAADKIQESLEMSPDYDADKDTVLVWLQDIKEKSKGSFGVKPSGLLKSYAIEHGAIDDIAAKSVKPFMPGNPPKALIQLATNLDERISEIDRIRSFLVNAGKAIAIAFGVGSIAFFAWMGAGILKKQHADRQEIIDKTKKLKSKIEEWNNYYESTLKDRPEILFDLAVALEEHEILPLQNLFDACVGRYTSNTVDFCRAIHNAEKQNKLPEVSDYIEIEAQVKKSIGDFLEGLESEYGDWLRSRNNPERFCLVPPTLSICLMGKEFNFKATGLPGIEETLKTPRSLELHKKFDKIQTKLTAESKAFSDNGNLSKLLVGKIENSYYRSSSLDLPPLLSNAPGLDVVDFNVVKEKLTNNVLLWKNYCKLQEEKALEVICESVAIPVKELHDIANDIDRQYSLTIGDCLSQLKQIVDRPNQRAQNEYRRVLDEQREQAEAFEQSRRKKMSDFERRGRVSRSTSLQDSGQVSSDTGYTSDSGSSSYSSDSGGSSYDSDSGGCDY
jgi:hypothetical protein